MSSGYTAIVRAFFVHTMVRFEPLTRTHEGSRHPCDSYYRSQLPLHPGTSQALPDPKLELHAATPKETHRFSIVHHESQFGIPSAGFMFHASCGSYPASDVDDQGGLFSLASSGIA